MFRDYYQHKLAEENPLLQYSLKFHQDAGMIIFNIYLQSLLKGHTQNIAQVHCNKTAAGTKLMCFQDSHFPVPRDELCSDIST